MAAQADFGAGIYRGREAPDNAAYDLLNCLIDDEGQPFKRGGSAYRSSTNAGAALIGLGDLPVAAGRRTLFATASALGVVSDAGAVTTHSISPDTVQSFTRWPVTPPGYAIIPAVSSSGTRYLQAYAGATKAAYSTGTLDLTQGSATVAGAGTSWTANLEAGMLLSSLPGVAYSSTQDMPVIKSVESNTSLTLTKPWQFTTATGRTYQFSPNTALTLASSLGSTGRIYVTVAGRRVLIGAGQIVRFSAPDNTLNVPVDDYHDVPVGDVIGLEGVGGSAYVFTTAGMFLLDGLYFDELDDVGNIQHRLEQVNELVLWEDAGVARWRGALAVPCIDDVWLMGQGDAPVPIGGGIKPLYLSYVKAGYQPGLAATHRSHYFLPILNGSTLVDMLVCRLDRGFAWTRWSGHGAGVGYAERIGSTTRTPKLFGANGQRVTDLTDAWDPSSSNSAEADTTVHTLTIETRDQQTPGGSKGSTTRKLRVRYEATVPSVAPTFTVSYARGVEGASFTSLGSPIRGGGVSDGLDESVWPVGKQAPAIRYRITSTSAMSTFKLRGVTTEFLPRGA
jgi:hypothetical protein